MTRAALPTSAPSPKPAAAPRPKPAAILRRISMGPWIWFYAPYLDNAPTAKHRILGIDIEGILYYSNCGTTFRNHYSIVSRVSPKSAARNLWFCHPSKQLQPKRLDWFEQNL